MLNRFDDYPIHQTAEPLAHPATGDRNAYDRYWFNGYTRDGAVFFAGALGLYPNRRVMDAAFSVLVDGTQYALYASRRAPLERSETRVGPICVEVVQPMRAIRLRTDSAEHGIAAELLFDARTPAVEEPRVRKVEAGRVLMDSTRFTQFGTWRGTITVAGRTLPISADQTLGTRDRSWGVRPVGEPETGPAAMTPQFFWIWAPIHFADLCAHFQTNEDAEGRSWHATGVVVPLLDQNAGDDALVDASAPSFMRSVSHQLRWAPGTRRAASARLVLEPPDGAPHELVLEPLTAFYMRGLGYLHPEWGHGIWHGEQAVGFDSWRTGEIDPMEPRHLHVQQLCRARMGERSGLGVLEQLVIGPHVPSGFRSILDAAE